MRHVRQTPVSINASFICYNRKEGIINASNVCFGTLHGVTCVFFRPTARSVQSAHSTMADQLELKLVLEANDMRDIGRLCQQLSEHGVSTLGQFTELSEERLAEWGIRDYRAVRNCALRHARKLSRNSTQDLATIKQQLLVRARVSMHMLLCNRIALLCINRMHYMREAHSIF